MIDSRRPYALLNEREPFRDSCGNVTSMSVSTLFLTARRCPINCSMCDLHENTFSHATPEGDIVRQIEIAQQQLEPSQWVKLYNSGNFFDRQSIPPADYQAIADLCQRYERVIVENHPRLGDSLHAPFCDLISAQLEVAVGLETVQPRWLERIGKQMTRDQFDRYATKLQDRGIDLRVFLIVGMPGVSVSESLRWARLAVRHASLVGARHISLIPARSGNGWNRQADQLPKISLGNLADLFADSLNDLHGSACLSADLWGFESGSSTDLPLAQLSRFKDAICKQDASLL